MIAAPAPILPPNYSLDDKPIIPYKQLPDEILKFILELLSIQDLGRLGSVSRGLYIKCSEDRIWAKHAKKIQIPHIKYQLICSFALHKMGSAIHACVSPWSALQLNDGQQASNVLSQMVEKIFKGNIRTVELEYKKGSAGDSYLFKLTLNKIRNLEFEFKKSTVFMIQIPKEVTFGITTYYRSLSFPTPLTINLKFLCGKIEIGDHGALEFKSTRKSLYFEPSFSIQRNSVKPFLDSCLIKDSEETSQS